MATAPVSAAASRRPRHDPRETEREILDAAEQLLREHPFRDFTVQAVMARTGLKRPAFYVHFRDRHDLALRVVDRIGDELLAVADRWFEGGEATDGLHTALEGVVAVYVDHGTVLRALADASGSDATVEAAYRALVQRFIAAAAQRIRAEQAVGRATGIEADETARALVWLNESYLRDALGREPITNPTTVVAVLERIWTATLSGDGQPPTDSVVAPLPVVS